MSHSYETVVVFDGSLGDDVLRKEQGAIESFLTKNAKFEQTVLWGKRDLAYHIRRKRLGMYCIFMYQGTGEVVKKLEADFGLNPSVLRFLTIAQTPKPRVAEKASEKPASGSGEEANNV